jgi:peptidoglycan/LPS O-acetylase OafA/YrhL
MVMVFFPLLVLGGAHWQIGRVEMMFCKLAGRLSYPIYILHFPFLFVYMNYVTFTKPPAETAHVVAAGAFVFVMSFAWVALTVYDEPVRKRLRKWTGRPAR